MTTKTKDLAFVPAEHKARKRDANIRNKIRMSSLTILFNIVLDIPASGIRQGNEIKGIQIEGRSKIILIP